jgi:hypothetical protein
MDSYQALTRISYRFASGNEVPIESARITLDELTALQHAHKEENDRCIKLLEERAERTTPEAKEIYLIAIEVIRSRNETTAYKQE